MVADPELAALREREQIGWLSARWTPDHIGVSVHRHFFGTWTDEVSAAHRNCRPVYVDRLETP